jgi:hypothetical protein
VADQEEEEEEDISMEHDDRSSGQDRGNEIFLLNILLYIRKEFLSRGRIFNHVRPFYERAVSDLDP